MGCCATYKPNGNEEKEGKSKAKDKKRRSNGIDYESSITNLNTGDTKIESIQVDAKDG